jgi:hypothetical protein
MNRVRIEVFPMPVSRKSFQSLLIRLTANSQDLAQATGFILEAAGNQYLITNWHCLSGRNPELLKPEHASAAIPNAVTIWHNKHNLANEMEWVERTEALVDGEGNPLWLEHPKFRNRADIAAIRLSNLEGVEVFA